MRGGEMSTEEQDIANATFTVQHKDTGERRDVTQQQFMDENLDSNGWRSVNPLNSIEAQRRIDAPELDEDNGDDTPAGEGDTDFDSWTKPDLEAEADSRGLTVKRSGGEDGEPLKQDYVRALRRAERKARRTE